MKIVYVGPSDSVTVAGLTFVRGEPQDVSDDLAGRVPSPRLLPAMLELRELRVRPDRGGRTDEQALVDEIDGLDRGEGLLAQDVWVKAPPAKSNQAVTADNEGDDR